jgi:hypothetical protein
MVSHFTPKRVHALRDIPIVTPPASKHWITTIITSLAACILAGILYQIAIMTNHVTSAGYERQWHASEGYLAPFVNKVSLTPPVYLAAGDALVAQYTVDIAKGGVNLSLARRDNGGFIADRTTAQMFLPTSSAGSIRLVALADGWYRPVTSTLSVGKAAPACGENLHSRSLVENWLSHDPACSLHDVAYSVMWRMDRKRS